MAFAPGSFSERLALRVLASVTSLNASLQEVKATISRASAEPAPAPLCPEAAPTPQPGRKAFTVQILLEVCTPLLQML